VTSASAAQPRKGPLVINPRGRAPEFTLKDGLYVSIDQVKAALDGRRRLVIADARPPSDWLSLHITGAISTPFYDPKAIDGIPKDGTWVITYCGCPHHLSGVVADALRKGGYPHVAVLDEGIFAWQQKKYPVVMAPGTRPPPAPPPMPGAPPAPPGPSFQKSKR
jgi:cytochrome c oxidase cbb3-type subunit 3/ubiquinol-cytochrome c reductase cytochrome c subunit